VGILPTGFWLRMVSLSLPVSAFSILMSLARPSTWAAILTLRANGEAGEKRSIIMGDSLVVAGRSLFSAAADGHDGHARSSSSAPKSNGAPQTAPVVTR